MALTIQIAGLDRTADLKPNSVTYDDTLNSRNTMQFTLHGKAASLDVPSDGEEVVFFDGATRLYAGVLTEPEQEILPGLGIRRVHCQASGYEVITDRRLVAAAYENQSTGTIVTDIVNTHLTGEGITLGTIEAGPTLVKEVFNYRTATECLNRLAELAGYAWWIDVNKALQFRASSSVVASTTITTLNCRWLKVRPSRERYRNKQFIRAGVDLTDARTDRFVGDGKARTWVLKFPVGKVPSAITVNAVGKTIGIHQVESGKDFYWNKSDPVIKQDDSGTLLTSADELAVTYRGEFPIIVTSQDDAEINTRKTAEGAGTGIYEAIEDEPQIDDADVAIDLSAALLARHGRLPKVVDFFTDVTGLRAGQMLPIDVSEYGLNGQFLIQRVNASDSQGQKLWFAVQALSNDATGGWQEYFRRLQAARRKLDEPRDNEVVNNVRSTMDEIFCHDVLRAIQEDAADVVAKVDTGRVGFSEVG